MTTTLRFLEALGRRFKDKCRRTGIPVAAVCRHTGITQGTASLYINGKSDARLGTVKALEQGLSELWEIKKRKERVGAEEVERLQKTKQQRIDTDH